jgi:hypothetical protein
MAFIDSHHDEKNTGAPSTERRAARAAAQPHRWDQASVETLAQFSRGAARLYRARPDRRVPPRQQQQVHRD